MLLFIKTGLLLLLSLLFLQTLAQETAPTHYLVTFPNLAHHEAEISATFQHDSEKPLHIRMARSSPGRYALHEFAKNIYNIRVTDEKGKPLTFDQPNPHEWVVRHAGKVVFRYTLFGDRADGTYNQIEQTHAHLNIPATFVYGVGYDQKPIYVDFHVPGTNWTAATQLTSPTNRALRNSPDWFYFSAPNLQYFMDSPIELAPFTWRSWETTGPNGYNQTIRIALHHTGTEQDADAMEKATRKIVQEQKAVFGELPKFEDNRYTFIACYMPHASGDGMEHRNSTILTSPRCLKEGFLDNLGTVSHEFFHAWNVERIRPKSLEPFRYEEANMSEALWLAEGFTSYYGELAMVRAGIYSEEDYLRSLEGDINAYLLSPGAHQYSPVHMSRQAPFVDAARSVDPTNRHNTFLSYYTYGSVLGAYLDLSLRSRPTPLTLDGFMQLLWQRFGKEEKPYTLPEIETALADFTQDKTFAQDFFRQHIYTSGFLNFEPLLNKMGIEISPKSKVPHLGYERLVETERGLQIATGTVAGSALYEAGLDRDDQLLTLNGKKANTKNLQKILAGAKPGEEIQAQVASKGHTRTVALKPVPGKAITLKRAPATYDKKMADANFFRNSWLLSQTK